MHSDDTPDLDTPGSDTPGSVDGADHDPVPSLVGRRRFLGAAGSALAGGALLAACSGDDDTATDDTGTGATTGATTGASAATGDVEAIEVATSDDLPEINWEMTTSWPAGLTSLFGTPENGSGAVGFGVAVGQITGGRFTITAKQAGELAGPLEVIDVLQSGAVPAGHTASYYYLGKSNVFAFGTALPFGLTCRQQYAWLFQYRDADGQRGLDVLRDFYASEYGVINFPAGNTGCQMGGFFNKEINSLADLQGLVMRIPGLGGEVMTRLGVTTQVLAGGEIAQALQTNAIDAAEFVGPLDDNVLGLGEAGRFYYYPGWWEAGPSLDVFVSLEQYNDLPPFYQQALELAGELAFIRTMGYYDGVQPEALAQIRADGAETRPFPDDVMEAAREESGALLDELAAADANFQTVLDHWRPYRDAVSEWHGLAELSMLQANA
jgi:TRAP-type mannitol/chloroaromatic compound transport system substrate-binding protein